ncbi:hypothetical protein N9933_01500 [bacterium]|nr:hypothetical protein [bacterium]
MRATKNSQDKLQGILKSLGFVIRYERGNFRGGHCIVMEEQMIIINKFFPLESKITTLMAIIQDIEVDESLLSDDQKNIVHKLKSE